MDIAATVSSKGQITLPKAIRDELGLAEGDHVLFRLHRGRAVLAKVPDFLDLAGSMPVPATARGKRWAEIRRDTWTHRTSR